MYVTPQSGPNLLYWNWLPMSVSNYGGDLQVCNVPEYIGKPLMFGLNPCAENYIRTSAFDTNYYGGCYGGGVGGVDTVAANAIAASWVAAPNQNNAMQSYSQTTNMGTALKTTLNSMLLNANATDEDRTAINEYLTKIDEHEAALKAIQNQELTTFEVGEKSREIETKLREIGTEVGKLNSKLQQAAAQAAQQQSNQTDKPNNDNATVAQENPDPEAERKSQT